MAADLEVEICRLQHALICKCCLGELPGSICGACQHAIGFHYCQDSGSPPHLLWRRGTLHGGELDVQRILFNLHRKGLPTVTLREKCDEYENAGFLTVGQANYIMNSIEKAWLGGFKQH